MPTAQDFFCTVGCIFSLFYFERDGDAVLDRNIVGSYVERRVVNAL